MAVRSRRGTTSSSRASASTWRRSQTFQRADSRPSPTASTAWSTSRSRTVRAVRRHSSLWSVDHGWCSADPIVRSTPSSPPASRSKVWRASTSLDAGSTSETATPTAAPRSVSTARRPAWLLSCDAIAESTMSPLTGTCLAAARGSRSTNSATPSETATSAPTVSPLRSNASPIATARRTPSTTAALRWSAVRIDARTETWTTTRAVSGARTGSGAPVTTVATAHASPAARPDFATCRSRSTWRRPRHRVGQPPPPSPGTAAEPTRERGHDRALVPRSVDDTPTHVHTLGRRGCHQTEHPHRRGQHDAHHGDRRTTRELAARACCRAVSAACYGTVLVLAALPLIDADEVSSGLGRDLVTGVGVGRGWRTSSPRWSEIMSATVRGPIAPRSSARWSTACRSCSQPSCPPSSCCSGASTSSSRVPPLGGRRRRHRAAGRGRRGRRRGGRRPSSGGVVLRGRHGDDRRRGREPQAHPRALTTAFHDERTVCIRIRCEAQPAPWLRGRGTPGRSVAGAPPPSRRASRTARARGRPA